MWITSTAGIGFAADGDTRDVVPDAAEPPRVGAADADGDGDGDRDRDGDGDGDGAEVTAEAVDRFCVGLAPPQPLTARAVTTDTAAADAPR